MFNIYVMCLSLHIGAELVCRMKEGMSWEEWYEENAWP
jgi:hypothetical protein